MNIFVFSPNDQRQGNWLIHRWKVTDLGFEVIPEFSPFVHFSSKCKKFSHDAVFDFGFPDTYILKLRGDIAVTLDGFLCMNEKTIQLIESNRFPGLLAHH